MRPGDEALGREVLYNGCDPDDVEAAMKLVGTHSAGTLMVPATWTAYREIPSTYILTENDRALPPSIQERIIAAGEGAFDVVRCQEGHAPYLSNPDFVVDCIRRAAGETV
jgi:pimeloyl-ACP methyl ester carboxylesterase